MSNEYENENFDDLPIVALLEIPFHELSDEKRQELVKALREKRTNAAKDRAEKKAASRVLQGKTAKKNSALKFNPRDLLK